MSVTRGERWWCGRGAVLGLVAALVAAPFTSGCSGEAGAEGARAGGAASAPGAPAAVEPVVWERMAVIGASASAGFMLNDEAGREVRLADVLALAAPGTFHETLDAASLTFFMQPDASLDEALAELREFRPHLVLAPDVLFWFGYGPKSDENRVKHLRQAMARIETFLDETGAVLLVGDLPDVRDASVLMMPPRYEPTDGTLAALNAEVAAWCERRPDVVPVPLADFVEHLRAGEPIEVFGRTLDTSDRSRWLQRDRLHPTLEGTAALAVLLLEALEGVAPLGASLRTDPAALAEDLRAR